jgi:hypothetical protein
MKITVDWQIIPTHTFNIADFSIPYDLSLSMKNLKISKYLYQVTFKGIVLKYGMSADNSRSFGERIYRQIGHSKSWGNSRLTGSSGSDWRIIEEDFFNLYGIEIDRNFMVVKIWDVSNYPFTTINPWFEINAIEQQLIERYVLAVGEKPLGNINDESNAIIRPAISKNTWQQLFEE